jgi:hypothetical protein
MADGFYMSSNGELFIGFNGAINLNNANIPIRFAEDVIGYIHNPYPSFTGELPNRSSTQANGQGITFYNSDYNKMPYVQNWNIGFQYQLPASTVVELRRLFEGEGHRAGEYYETRAAMAIERGVLMELRSGQALQAEPVIKFDH